MLVINARNLGGALKRIRTAARNLGMVLKAKNTASCHRWLWSLAEAVQPLASEPHSFWLGPSNSRYAQKYGLSQLRRRNLPKDPLEVIYLFATFFEQDMMSLQADLVGLATRIIQKELPATITNLSDEEWTLNFIRSLKSPGPIPSEIFDVRHIHLGAYLSFHLGALGSFATACVQHPKFKSLSSFWQGFLEWHCEQPTAGCQNILEQVAASSSYSKGCRRTALLLLWTRSNKTLAELVRITKANSEVMESSVRYHGSETLPVSETGIPPQFQDAALQRLKYAADKSPQGSSLEKDRHDDISDAFGGSAKPPVTDFLERLKTQHPLRVAVTGGREADRVKKMVEIASIRGLLTKDLVKWSSLDALEKKAQFRADLQAWKAGNQLFGHLLRSLLHKALLATEIQAWSEFCRQLLTELLDPLIAPGLTVPSWPDPVLVSRDRSIIKDFRNQLLQQLGSRLGLHLHLSDPSGQEWLAYYTERTVRQLEGLSGVSKSKIQTTWPKEDYCPGFPKIKLLNGHYYVHIHLLRDLESVDPSDRPRVRRRNRRKGEPPSIGAEWASPASPD